MTTIVLKYSLVPGRKPTPDQLVMGEVALNVADGTMYTLNPSNEVVEVRPLNLRDQQVLTSKLADFAVTEGKIASGAITLDKLAPEVQAVIERAITAADLADGAVTLPKLAPEVMAAVDAKVSAEAAARQAADEALSARVDSVLSNIDSAALDSLTEVVDAFKAADSSINGALSSLANSSAAAVAAEEAARKAADDYLTANLQGTQESVVSRFDALDARLTPLEQRVTAEINRAEQAEAQLDTKVSDEAAARAAGDASLQAQLTSLQATLSAVNDSGVSAVNGVITSLADEVAARQAADRNLDDRISTLQVLFGNTQAGTNATLSEHQGLLNALAAKQDAEQQARINADGLLQAGVNSLFTSMDAEIHARIDGDAALDAKVLKEIADRVDAIAAVRSEIAAVESNFIAGTEAEVVRIDAEFTALKARVAALEGTISGGTF